MNRLGFLATLLAPVLAKVVPKPKTLLPRVKRPEGLTVRMIRTYDGEKHISRIEVYYGVGEPAAKYAVRVSA